MPSNIAVELRDVTKRYRPGGGIEGVTLRFDPGRLHLLVGPNGSGKSTLLKCIAGVVRHEGGIEVRPHSIGYAPEDYVLPQFMTVRAFLLAAGRVRDHEPATLAERIDELLAFYGMTAEQHKPFFGLSNGMRQKANLMQAFLNRPRILLLDEPLRGLDEEARDRTVAMVKALAKERLVIVSTHFPERFRCRAATIVRIENGRIRDAGDA